MILIGRVRVRMHFSCWRMFLVLGPVIAAGISYASDSSNVWPELPPGEHALVVLTLDAPHYSLVWNEYDSIDIRRNQYWVVTMEDSTDYSDLTVIDTLTATTIVVPLKEGEMYAYVLKDFEVYVNYLYLIDVSSGYARPLLATWRGKEEPYFVPLGLDVRLSDSVVAISNTGGSTIIGQISNGTIDTLEVIRISRATELSPFSQNVLLDYYGLDGINKGDTMRIAEYSIEHDSVSFPTPPSWHTCCAVETEQGRLVFARLYPDRHEIWVRDLDGRLKRVSAIAPVYDTGPGYSEFDLIGENIVLDYRVDTDSGIVIFKDTFSLE